MIYFLVSREMCSQGHSVLCIIHQPNSELFQIFDRVLLLSEGRTAFMGSQKDAKEFFDG
jgi:ABC-type multidrug transport system ATPase subunit